MERGITEAHLNQLRSAISGWRLDADEQEEVVSATLFAFAKCRNRGDEFEHIGHWLVSCANLVRKKWIRERTDRRNRERTFADGFWENQKQPHHAGGGAPECSFIDMALSTLRDRSRNMVYLCLIQGMQTAEAARLLNLNYSTAISALKRGCNRLSRNPELCKFAESFRITGTGVRRGR